jgi:hypothetical protein
MTPALIWNMFVLAGGAYLVTAHGWSPMTMLLAVLLLSSGSK